jgi:hypothetical protein
MTTLAIIFWLMMVSLVVLYISGRYYLRESFVQESPQTTEPDHRAFATEPIQKLDDYEYSAVFNNEGSRAVSKREISDAMSRYPLNWTARPPSDETFQTYREAFVDASERNAMQGPPPAIQEKYASVSGDAMIPPDTSAQEMEERAILAMYNPEEPVQLKEYEVNPTLERVKDMVKKVYDKRGLTADVERSKQGQNIFEIVEARPKDEKIVWEDEQPSDTERAELRGEQQISVPYTVNDIAAGLDPFFEPRTTVRMDRSDYTRWTPGLERQFAPTYSQKSWY